MIPNFNQSGVLPPFTGDVTNPFGRAPYKVDFSEVVTRFNTSPKRKSVLSGLDEYRNQLHLIGIRNGFQWLDGSFIEDCESNRNRDPNDIDLLTFAFLPKEININNYEQLFDPEITKQKYSCDAYFIDLGVNDPIYLVNQTHYWFGLFTHQRESYLWKGILEIPLCNNYTYAKSFNED